MFLYDSYTFYFSKQTFRTSIKLCCSLEQVASLRSARQAHADATELDSLYSENGSVTKAVFAANPLGESPLFFVYGIFRFLSVFTGADFRLIAFAHLAYYFLAHFAHVQSLVPTYEVVKQ